MCSTQMQTYSREFLQSIPEKKKQQEFDAMVQNFWNALYQVAESGQTLYFFDMTNIRKVSSPDLTQRNVIQTARSINTQTTMTNEEIVTRFQQKFPECLIKYSEEWVESNASTKILKRGITVDWS